MHERMKWREKRVDGGVSRGCFKPTGDVCGTCVLFLLVRGVCRVGVGVGGERERERERVGGCVLRECPWS